MSRYDARPEPGGGHEAAGISRCSRWRFDLAACRDRPAVNKIADHRIFQPDYVDDHAAADGRVRAATARAWLEEGRPSLLNIVGARA